MASKLAVQYKNESSPDRSKAILPSKIELAQMQDLITVKYLEIHKRKVVANDKKEFYTANYNIFRINRDSYRPDYNILCSYVC